MDKTYSVVDIETTGLSPEENEIIEIGIVKISKGKTKSKYHSLVKPKNKIPYTINKLTGITDDMVKKSPPFEKIAGKLNKFIGDTIFVAHNAVFDFNVINASLRRSGVSELNSKVIDTQELVTILYPTLSSHRLSSLTQKLGIDIKEKHRALSDAVATAKLFLLIMEEIKKMNTGVLRSIVQLSYKSNWPLYDIFYEALKKKNININDKIINFNKDILRPATEILLKKKRRIKEKAIISQDEVNEFFSKKGPLGKNIAHYEARTSQTEMVNAITNAFNKSGHLIVEAGTGTGKSIAYLFPSILFSLKNQIPVVISTRTKNLQEQLIDKDIPLLKKSLKHDFYAVVVKGMENYFCLRKWDMHYRLMLKKMTKEDFSIFFGLLNWLSITKTGDMSELHSMLYYKANKEYRSNSITCLKDMCPYLGRCFHNRVRRQAHKADVIIVNHALLFSDICSGGSILPEYNQLIIDEAHNIEDAATESFSVILSSKIIFDNLKKFVDYKGSLGIIEEIELLVLNEVKNQEILKKIKEIIKEVNKYIDQAFKNTRKAFEVITNYVHSEKNKEIGHVNIAPQKRGEIWKLIISLSNWQDVVESIGSLHDVIKNIVQYLESLKEILEANISSKKAESVYLDVLSVLGQFQDTLNAVKFVFNNEENYVSWIEVDTSSNPWITKVYSAPINVGSFIYESIFSKKENVILTSATLSVNGSFDYLKKRIGLMHDDLEVNELRLGTEFDYQKQALVCVPRGTNIIKENGSGLGKIAEFLANIIILTQGRTLVLFTSYKMLQDIYFLSQEMLNSENISVYCQGRHGSRRSILERFKDEKKAVIFGTDSFWEGVDLPGKELSCLVMMKLPFAVPTEPIILARTEDVELREGNGFINYSVPYAVIKFRQGIGRLIRTKKDKGVAVIFDNRLYEKTYGQSFLNSIPDYCKIYEPREDILNAIESWLN